MEPVPDASPTQQILKAAHAQLVDREQKLVPLAERMKAELAEVQHGIKTIEKALGVNPTAPPRATRTRPSAQLQSSHSTIGFGQQVVNLLQTAGDSLTPRQINQALDRDPSYAHTWNVLKQLAETGAVVKLENGEWTVP